MNIRKPRLWPILVAILTAGTPLLAQTDAKGAFDDPPVPIKAVSPEYPASLKQEGATGVVMMRLLIDEHGNVVEHSVAKASHAEFGAAATAVITKWKFKPARKDGAVVRANITLPIKFAIEG